MQKSLIFGVLAAALAAPAWADCPTNAVDCPPLAARSITTQSVNGILYCDQYSDAQACHDALPANGGTMKMPSNKTYDLTARLTISKSNVTIECPSWSTIFRRQAGSAMTETVRLDGANDRIENCTVDGNAPTYTGYAADLYLTGANASAKHVQVINGGGNLQVGLAGADQRISDSTVAGLGSGTIGANNIWAEADNRVFIDHNIVSGSALECIGVRGHGTIVDSNRVSNCHNQTPAGGGSIVTFPVRDASYTASISGTVMTVTAVTTGTINLGDNVFDIGSLVPTGSVITSFGTGTGGTGTYNLAVSSTVASKAMYSESSQVGAMLMNNIVLPGANPLSGGIEINSGHTSIVGGMIDGGNGATTGIGGLWADAGTGPGLTITGVLLHNLGLPSGLGDGIYIPAGLTDFTITGVQIIDDRPTPLIRSSININTGASDRYSIVGNKLTPCGRTTCISDGGTGIHKIIRNNQGVDDVYVNAACAATFPIPLNPVFQMVGAPVSVTSIGGAWVAGIGTVKTVIPNNVFSFVAGNNIANSFTTVASMSFTMTFDGTKWSLK